MQDEEDDIDYEIIEAELVAQVAPENAEGS